MLLIIVFHSLMSTFLIWKTFGLSVPIAYLAKIFIFWMASFLKIICFVYLKLLYEKLYLKNHKLVALLVTLAMTKLLHHYLLNLFSLNYERTLPILSKNVIFAKPPRVLVKVQAFIHPYLCLYQFGKIFQWILFYDYLEPKGVC